jgi:hypothetical protein
LRSVTNLEGQVPVFISPRNRVAQLYAQALGSVSVVSYVSQGYGGDIARITRLHMRLILIVIIQFNSCLFTCKLNSTEANYKVSTST